METVQIQKVAVLGDGRIAVFPDRKEADWQYIYREASGVYWDQQLGCFHSNEPPRTWGNKEWYEQIISVVAGVGLRMRLASDVIFDCEAPEFENEIQAAESSVQKWIDDGRPPRQ